MLRANRALILFVLVALILSAFQPVSASPVAAPVAQSGGELAPPTPRPDAPPYGARGPYPVGVRDFVIDTPERQIPVTVWYPALNPEGAEEFVAYSMDFLADPAVGFPTGGRALRDAEPDPSGGPYPLVLYSHGAWCFPAMAGFFTEHLASHGFVVMAPVHEDNWGTIFESTWRSEVSRPQDMKRVLDFAEESTAPGGELGGLIDMENVAVTGQSFGGAIALEMGGARLNLAEWQETFCVDFPEDEDCKAYPAHFEEMAALAGLDAVPEGLWPDWSDPRIDVVLATAPGVSMLGGGGLEGMSRPFMLLMGTGDNMVGPAHEYRQFYATLPGPDKTRGLFENADHSIFGNACPAYPGVVDAGFYFVCSDLVWDMNRAHDLTNHFATAFLLAELKGDADAAAALAPENVAFPGIRYETTAFGSAAKPAATLDDATVAKIEDVVEQAMAKSQVPGAAVGIVKDGQLVYAKGFGVAELGSDRPVTTKVLFHMASVNKTVVATAIMQLVEAGKIDLDAPVTDYLPDFKLADGRYEDITVRQLLSHRSGMPDVDWAALEREFRVPRTDDAALDDYVRSMDSYELLSAPGESFSYSCLGFDILGDIVAKVSGQSYEQYVQDRIFSPLGMADTTSLLSEADPTQLAEPHTYGNDGKPQKLDYFPYTRVHAPCNNLYTNIDDLSQLAMAHLNRGELDGKRILSAAAYDELWTPTGKTGMDEWFGPAFSDYGLGWFIGEEDGHTIFSHPGADEGFQSEMMLAPDQDLGVMAAVNLFDSSDGTANAYLVADEVLKLLLAEEPAAAAPAEGLVYTLNPELVAKIESMVQEMMAKNEIPGYALGIVKDGQIVYTKGFGIERVGEDKPVTVHSVFGTGSTGKTATATAIMQLVEEGKIDLDAPVTTYLPYFKLADERYKDITVRLLLEHRSGMPADPEDWFPLPVEYDDGALEREVRRMDKLELLFAPDEQWSYSSLGMVILGDIVQKVSGQTFENYLQENIIDPLGMSDTMLIIPESEQVKVTGNHVRDEDGQVVVSGIFPYRRQFTPTGPLYSSITDMARFAAANLNRGEFEGARILPEATYDAMWSPTSKTTWDLGPIMNQTAIDYGMGWMLGEIDGHRIVDHGGYDEGYGAIVLLAPDDNVAVVMNSNYFDQEEFNLAPWETAIEIMQMLLADGQ